MDDFQFKKGMEVEISIDEEGFRGAWFSGKVIKLPAKNGKKVMVEYETLMADENGSTPLREEVDLVQIRPPAPRESSRVFNFDEEVDALYNDGWWEGVVTQVLETDQYSVYFRPAREQSNFKSSDLRLHREWVHGKWVPPFEEKAVQVQLTKGKKVYEQKAEKLFSPGSLVEVSSDEDGFEGAWFAATVVDVIGESKYLVEYKHFRTEDDAEFVREEVDELHIRPCPPQMRKIEKFKLYEEVDALHNDGWWVGIISKVHCSNYVVCFKGTNEEIEFNHDDLRLHQDWINGKWFMASQAMQPTSGKEVCGQKDEKLFSPGSLVEVSSDEDGYEGVWFSATIVEVIGENKYLIEYKDLRSEDDTEFLREEVDALHIRPCPPQTGKIGKYKLYEEVDALYNDGWWVGIISKVCGSKYEVFFKSTNEQMEFIHDDIRLHQDWINEKWVTTSQFLHLSE